MLIRTYALMRESHDIHDIPNCANQLMAIFCSHALSLVLLIKLHRERVLIPVQRFPPCPAS